MTKRLGKLELETSYDEVEWEMGIDYLNELINDMDNAGDSWKAEGRNMGWRNLTGHKEFRANNGEEMLREVLPDTDCKCDIEVFTDRIEMIVYHHDSPMGESYVIKPMKEEDYEA